MVAVPVNGKEGSSTAEANRAGDSWRGMIIAPLKELYNRRASSCRSFQAQVVRVMSGFRRSAGMGANPDACVLWKRIKN